MAILCGIRGLKSRKTVVREVLDLFPLGSNAIRILRECHSGPQWGHPSKCPRALSLSPPSDLDLNYLPWCYFIEHSCWNLVSKTYLCGRHTLAAGAHWGCRCPECEAVGKEGSWVTACAGGVYLNTCCDWRRWELCFCAGLGGCGVREQRGWTCNLGWNSWSFLSPEFCGLSECLQLSSMSQLPLLNGLDKGVYLWTASDALECKAKWWPPGTWPVRHTLRDRTRRRGWRVLKWGRNKEREFSLMTLPGMWKWNIWNTLFYVLSSLLISLFLFSSLSLPFFSSLYFWAS